ncbi:M20/M25/M40 family metallo-hydrolase [Isosphaeraceae bacterium EP7]
MSSLPVRLPRAMLALAFGSALFWLPTLALVAQEPAPKADEPAKKADDPAKKAEVPGPVKQETADEVAKKAADTAKDQAKADEDPIERIKKEGLERSQVMATLSHLTDVIGPRLTASPAMKRANEWTRDQMTEWGLVNAHLEPWGPFGRGWTLKRFSIQVSDPQCIPLIAYPKAWSPGFDAPVTAPLVYFDVKTESDFSKYAEKLKGAIVLVSGPREVPARFQPLGHRIDDAELLTLANADGPAARRPRADGPGGPNRPATGTAVAGQPSVPDRMAGMRADRELNRKKMAFLMESGAIALLDSSPQGDGGTIFVAQASVPNPGPANAGPDAKRPSAWDKDAKIPPQVTLAKEHANRLIRMIEKGEQLKVTLDLSVQFHEDDELMGFNTLAEIPGTDLKNEVVMLGGHMDSWHSGTGATDNAAGVAVAMEAARILKALDLKPRRTIRVALWSGEEQGLFGSLAYAKEHFGQVDGPSPGFGGGGGGAPPKVKVKPEHETFSAYYNLDNGTGKIRGIYLQGNEATRAIFRPWLAPFREMGAATITSATTGGTDHLAFDGLGLPGFQFIQDPVEYDTRTHHSNQDLYDRAQADDLKQASVVMAAFIYNTAQRDEKLPRKAIEVVK